MFQQGDVAQAEKCADQAVIADRYNAGGNTCILLHYYIHSSFH